MENSPTQELALEALHMAIKQRKPSLGFTPAFKTEVVNMLAIVTKYYWAKEVFYVQ